MLNRPISGFVLANLHELRLLGYHLMSNHVHLAVWRTLRPNKPSWVAYPLRFLPARGRQAKGGRLCTFSSFATYAELIPTNPSSMAFFSMTYTRSGFQ
jgi:hypothetical protein